MHRLCGCIAYYCSPCQFTCSCTSQKTRCRNSSWAAMPLKYEYTAPCRQDLNKEGCMWSSSRGEELIQVLSSIDIAPGANNFGSIWCSARSWSALSVMACDAGGNSCWCLGRGVVGSARVEARRQDAILREKEDS